MQRDVVTDGHADMMKLIASFRIFANAPKKIETGMFRIKGNGNISIQDREIKSRMQKISQREY
jgi:hypothetical protein